MTPPESLPQLLCEVLQTTVELQQFIVQVHLQCMPYPHRLQIEDTFSGDMAHSIENLDRTVAALSRALGEHPFLNTFQAALYPCGHGSCVSLYDIVQRLQPQAEGLKGQIMVGSNEYDEASRIILPQLLSQFQTADLTRKVNVQKVDSGN